MIFISRKAPDTGFTECPCLMCTIMITSHCKLDSGVSRIWEAGK